MVCDWLIQMFPEFWLPTRRKRPLLPAIFTVKMGPLVWKSPVCFLMYLFRLLYLMHLFKLLYLIYLFRIIISCIYLDYYILFFYLDYYIEWLAADSTRVWGGGVKHHVEFEDSWLTLAVLDWPWWFQAVHQSFEGQRCPFVCWNITLDLTDSIQEVEAIDQRCHTLFLQGCVVASLTQTTPPSPIGPIS